MSVKRTDLGNGLIVEEHEVEYLSWHRTLRVRVVFAIARLVRVPIAIRDEFYDTAVATVVAQHSNADRARYVICTACSFKWARSPSCAQCANCGRLDTFVPWVVDDTAEQRSPAVNHGRE